MTVLTISRAVEGAGAGGISVTASALVGEVVPLRYRGTYQGILVAMFGFGTVTGPLVGGFLTDHFGWQWVFWSNVPLAVVVMVVAATAIPKLAERPKLVFDYLGILLIALGTTGLILATSWGGTTYAWSSAPIIGLFVGSATSRVSSRGWKATQLSPSCRSDCFTAGPLPCAALFPLWWDLRCWARWLSCRLLCGTSAAPMQPGQVCGRRPW